jgi:hypothetical protein
VLIELCSVTMVMIVSVCVCDVCDGDVLLWVECWLLVLTMFGTCFWSCSAD